MDKLYLPLAWGDPEGIFRDLKLSKDGIEKKAQWAQRKHKKWKLSRSTGRKVK